MISRCGEWVAVCVILVLVGCQTSQPQVDIHEKLGAHQLALGSERDLPDDMKGRAIPLIVSNDAVLPADPAGYWVVGIDGEERTRDEILGALERWAAGEAIRLRVRRDPRYQPANEWWERDVELLGRW